jgi:hypothetical protein
LVFLGFRCFAFQDLALPLPYSSVTDCRISLLAAERTEHSAIMRDYDEGEVLLAAQKLRMRLQEQPDTSDTSLVTASPTTAGKHAVEPLVSSTFASADVGWQASALP